MRGIETSKMSENHWLAVSGTLPIGGLSLQPWHVPSQGLELCDLLAHGSMLCHGQVG